MLESGAKPDSCGVCNGDDSGAQSVTDTLTGSGWFGYYTAGVIPVGARNVRIAEATATSSVYLGKALSITGGRKRGRLGGQNSSNFTVTQYTGM